MFKIISYIIIFILSFTCQASYAEAASQAELENQLFELINNARINPLAAAVSIGMNPDQVLADLPELHDVLINGLPPLVFNANLQNSARSHVQDMLNRDYYSRVSPEGVTPEIRIAQSGYVGDATGESLGLLGFVNFVSPQEAVVRIFGNMFKDELLPGRTEKRNILSPELKDIGVGASAGALTLGTRKFNTYIAVCDFGAVVYPDSQIEAGENLLLELINNLRAEPLKIIAESGFNIDQVLAALPEMNDILINGLPALELNSSLNNSAEIQLSKILENKSLEVNKDDLYGRILDSGYAPKNYGEVTDFVICSQYADIESSVRQFFIKMLTAELDTENSDKFILNPELGDIGIALNNGWLETDAEMYSSCIFVCDFAENAVSSVEQELLLMLNQFRSEPLKYAESLGLNMDEIIENLSYKKDVLINGLPPLSFNPRLYLAARDHVEDMYFNEYIDHISLDGKTYEDRIEESGYKNIAASELVANSFYSQKPSQLLDNLIIEELTTSFYGDKSLINPGFKEVGIGFLNNKSKGRLSGLCTKEVSIMVLDLAASSEDITPVIEGVVYKDDNNNGVLDHGEGVSNIPLTIKNNQSIVHNIHTDLYGYFFLPVNSNAKNFTIKISDDDCNVIKNILSQHPVKSVYININDIKETENQQ